MLTRALPLFLMALAALAQNGPHMRDWQPPATEKRSSPTSACGSLVAHTGYEFTIITAREERAGDNGPAFCRVMGMVQPEVRFEVNLPLAWNRRLLFFGNGGYAGDDLDAPGVRGTRNESIAKGFLVARTNTGHDARTEPLGTFALNPQKLYDYAFRSLHVTVVTARRLAELYYGAPPQRSYYYGCSTGGRQGLIFAQRFPQLAFSAPIAEPVPVVFGLRSNARRLQRAVDERLADPQEKEAMALLMSAYGTDLPERGALRAVPCAGMAAALPTDLRLPRPPREGQDLALLAAVVLQRGTTDTVLVPAEHQRAGDDSGTTAEPRIAAAELEATTRYLTELDDRWRDEVPDPDQRLRFVSAGWLTGPDHVDDARALAAELKLDPQRWDGHVERAITLLALPRCFAATTVKHGFCKGADTFTGVRELVCLYGHFRAVRR